MFVLAVFMDISYLILFVNFFLQAYVLHGGKTKYRSLRVDSSEVDKNLKEKKN